MRIGDLEIYPVLDGQFVFAEPAGMPPKDSPEFAPHRNYITDDGLWLMDIGAFLVRSGRRLILIDAGAGQGGMRRFAPKPFTSVEDADPVLLAYQRSKGLSGEALERSLRMTVKTEVRHGMLQQSLANLGVRPEDITDVVFSHLHWDHIGWASAGGRPFFPNATLRAERRDLDFFLGEHPHDETFSTVLWQAMPAPERLAPVRDRIEPWDGDAVLAPGLNAMFAPGHTPGCSVFILSSRGQRAMILGDTVHCPLELMNPEFSLMADMDQALADRTREAIRREMDGADIKVTAPHFPGLQFGRLLPGAGKVGWSFEAWSRP
jgi:glyoxylase-like metal-dependent hydrolase (beta-lactamase superfamily II)